MKSTPEEIAKLDGRYCPEAFHFVYEGLGYTVKEFKDSPGHVSGQILCEGLRKMALERWGKLTLMVLESWQVTCTRDFGEIVYAMIKYEWMSAQPTDTINDFDHVYSFSAAFKDGFSF
jgi:uncharacterized repeat protein (TIGR04138 family)